MCYNFFAKYKWKALYKRCALLLIVPLSLFSLTIADSQDFQPHSAPLLSINTPPKPNVLLILNIGPGMNSNKDMYLPAGYEYPDSPQRVNVSRLDVHRLMVERLLKTYSTSAYIGFTQKSYTTPFMSGISNYRILKQPIEDLSDPAKREAAINIMKKLPITGTSASGSETRAFSLYESAKHLMGEPMLVYYASTSAYPQYTTVPSPVRYRCQSQHLIMFDDGHSNIFADGIHRPMKYILFPNSVSEGEKNLERVAGVLYTADARFTQNTTINGTTNKLDAAGKPWINKNEPRLPIYTHMIHLGNKTIGYSNIYAMPSMKAAAAKGQGIFTRVYDDGPELALKKVFARILPSNKSGGESIDDQTELSSATVRYTSRYNPSAWSGEIAAHRYNIDTEMFDQPLWTTTERIKPNQGEFFTQADNGQTVELTANGLGLPTSTKNEAMVAWLQGDNTGTEGLRIRPSLLGDIIESHPRYSARDRLNIDLSTLSTSVRENFTQYLLHKAQSNLKNLIIAGSNDGLINFILADKNRFDGVEQAGERYISYFPRFLAEQLDSITQSDYTHSFQINGTSTLFDAKVGPNYQTIGITSLAAGGGALVGYTLYTIDDRLLDTGSNDFKVNFEITKKSAGFEKLGCYSYSDVEFYNRQLAGSNPQPIAVFGNGFGAKKLPSVVYFIDATTGKQLAEIELADNTGGAASPAIVVKTDPQTGYQQLERLYVGDVNGNLFRLVPKTGVLGETFTADDFNITTLFQTEGPSQPITVRPALLQNQLTGEYHLYFGTGRAADKEQDRGPASKAVIQHFYGLADNNSGNTMVIDDLKEHRILSSDNTAGVAEVRTTRDQEEDTSWYLPLIANRGSNQGERVIIRATVYTKPDMKNRLLSTRFIHFTTWGINEGEDSDPCNPDQQFGKSFILNAMTGNSGNLSSVMGYSGKRFADDAPGRLSAPGIGKVNHHDNSELTAREAIELGLAVGDNSSYVHPDNVHKAETMPGATKEISRYALGMPDPKNFTPTNRRVNINKIF